MIGWRFGQFDGVSLKCCPCVKEPELAECIGSDNLGGNTVLANNVTDSKVIQFGGFGIGNGTACGVGTDHCNNLFGVPIVLDLNAWSIYGQIYANDCHWAYTLPVDSNCGDGGQPSGFALRIVPINPGGGNPTSHARFELDYQESILGQGTWTSGDLPIPIDAGAFASALNGIVNNVVFGVPPNNACGFDRITAEILS